MRNGTTITDTSSYTFKKNIIHKKKLNINTIHNQKSYIEIRANGKRLFLKRSIPATRTDADLETNDPALFRAKQLYEPSSELLRPDLFCDTLIVKKIKKVRFKTLHND